MAFTFVFVQIIDKETKKKKNEKQKKVAQLALNDSNWLSTAGELPRTYTNNRLTSRVAKLLFFCIHLHFFFIYGSMCWR